MVMNSPLLRVEHGASDHDSDKENTIPPSYKKSLTSEFPWRKRIPLQELDLVTREDPLGYIILSTEDDVMLSPRYKRTCSRYHGTDRKRSRKSHPSLQRSLSAVDVLLSPELPKEDSSNGTITFDAHERTFDGVEYSSSTEEARVSSSDSDDGLIDLFHRLRKVREEKYICKQKVKAPVVRLKDFIVPDKKLETSVFDSEEEVSSSDDFLPHHPSRIANHGRSINLNDSIFSNASETNSISIKGICQTETKRQDPSPVRLSRKARSSSWESVFSDSSDKISVSSPNQPTPNMTPNVHTDYGDTPCEANKTQLSISWLSSSLNDAAVKNTVSTPLKLNLTWSDASQILEESKKENVDPSVHLRNIPLFSDSSLDSSLNCSNLELPIQDPMPVVKPVQRLDTVFEEASSSDSSSLFSNSSAEVSLSVPRLLLSVPSKKTVPSFLRPNSINSERKVFGLKTSTQSNVSGMSSNIRKLVSSPTCRPIQKRDFLSSLSVDCPDELRKDDCNKYFTQFRRHREELLKRLFVHFNQEIFDNRLPAALPIRWNPRLTKTAGRCRCFSRKANSSTVRRISNARVSLYVGAKAKRSSAVVVSAANVVSGHTYEFCVRIEISVKVCHNAERTRDTLIHELCHAAVWLLNRQNSDSHGPLWRFWVAVAQQRCPTLPPITVYHTYAIATKFTYCCQQCGSKVNRHSRSLDITKKVCGRCRGNFELLINTPSGPRLASQVNSKPGNSFAQFVRKHYGEFKSTPIKQANSYDSSSPTTNVVKPLLHKEVMQILAEKFKAMKMENSS